MVEISPLRFHPVDNGSLKRGSYFSHSASQKISLAEGFRLGYRAGPLSHNKIENPIKKTRAQANLAKMGRPGPAWRGPAIKKGPARHGF